MDFIDKIFIINLKERTDRWTDIMLEMEEMQVPLDKIERFDAIRHEKSFMGCTMSHLACMRLAQQRGYQNVLILEDDFSVYNVDNFYQQLWKLEEIDFVWDVIFFSANVLGQQHYNEHFNKITDAQTTSGYLVHSHYFSTLINNFQQCVDSQNFIDMYWKKLQAEGRWFIFKQKIGYQRPSFSDIENKVVNYAC